jgi:hypothetical protein
MAFCSKVQSVAENITCYRFYDELRLLERGVQVDSVLFIIVKQTSKEKYDISKPALPNGNSGIFGGQLRT